MRTHKLPGGSRTFEAFTRAVLQASDRQVRRIAIWASLALACAPAVSAPARPAVDQFYSGKQLILVIGGGEGGGYDFYGRLFAQFMGRHLPGHPTVIAQNMPGAGGVIAANYLFNVAPKDGTVIGIVGRAVTTQPLIYPNDKGPRYVATQFNWIGTPEQECGLLIARLPSPIKSLQDLKTHELILSGTTADSPSSFYPRLLNKLVGTKFKVIDGYMSSPPAILAVERGEVEGHLAGSASAPLRSQIDPWIKSGKVEILAQVGLTRDPRNGDAPLITDLVETKAQRDALTLLLAQQTIAWPFLAPPGVPAERVNALREAFDATLTDQAFLAAAAAQKVGIDPMNGAKVEALIKEIYASPKDVLQLLARLSSEK